LNHLSKYRSQISISPTREGHTWACMLSCWLAVIFLPLFWQVLSMMAKVTSQARLPKLPTNIVSGWKWVMYWCAIFLAIGFVFCFFFMEETNYDRAPLEMVTTPTDTPGTATPKEGTISSSDDPEKTAAAIKSDSSSDNGASIVHYKPKTYIQKLALLDKKRKFNLFRTMLRPLLFLSLPSVVYAGFSYGSNLVWFNVLNGTASLILSAAPYNFSSSMVGLSYVSPLIGVACGSFYSGVIGDRIVLWLARRNKGVLESEHRLWLFSASLILIPGSLILWGVGAAHHIHWYVLGEHFSSYSGMSQEELLLRHYRP